MGISVTVSGRVTCPLSSGICAYQHSGFVLVVDVTVKEVTVDKVDEVVDVVVDRVDEVVVVEVVVHSPSTQLHRITPAIKSSLSQPVERKAYGWILVAETGILIVSK